MSDGGSTHHFDAKEDAKQVEHLVQTYLEALGDNKHSAQSSAHAAAAKKDLLDLLAPIFCNSGEKKALATELEKLGDATFSYDPNVWVTRSHGDVDALSFKRSAWNISAANDEVLINTHTDQSNTTYLDFRVSSGADASVSRPISSASRGAQSGVTASELRAQSPSFAADNSADGAVPVLHGNDRKPAPYKGGIGPDAPQVGAIMRRLGPEATLAWNSFLENYNDRSGESVLPRDLPLNEIDPALRGKLNWYGPFGDSDMSYVSTKSGRDLKPFADTSPGSSKSAGHVYAIATSKDADGALAPVEILDYESRDGQSSRYYGQYQFQYTNTNDGGVQVDISQYNPVNSSVWEPVTKDIAGIKQALNGLTRYTFDAGGNLKSAAQYLPFDLNKPIVALQFGNGGQGFNETTGQRLDSWSMSLAAPKLMFFDLFGPKRD